MIGHAWHQYWSWVGGNVGAMPLQALIGVAVSLLLMRPLRWLWRKVTGYEEIRRATERAERASASAHRIAADLYEHHTGRRHPAAPDAESEAT